MSFERLAVMAGFNPRARGGRDIEPVIMAYWA